MMNSIPSIAEPAESGRDAKTVIEALHNLEKNEKKLLRSKEFNVHGAIWESWTFRESTYRKSQETIPISARGLFTCGNTIVIRGYDKFFSVNETAATQWVALEKETVGPYEITAKENGCIIFIAAPTAESVVVTSKHSIPDPQDNPASHGGVGYRWLLKHLVAVQKTESDLAKWLHENDVTLVAELCDDKFEEHILAYNENQSGLYVHGINHNTSILNTLSGAVVQQVAEHFGLLSVDITIADDFKKMKTLAEEVRKTGHFRGREVEGIVVRCKRHDKDFFFKIKSDEYLIYREYREKTKEMLDVSTSGTVTLKSDVKPKCRYQKTMYYLQWLRERVCDHPEWFTEFKKNKGIVAARMEFEKFWDQGNLHFTSDPTRNVEKPDKKK